VDINVTLLDPNGDPLPVESVTVTQSINRGWTWSAVLSHMPHGYTVLEDTDCSLLDAFLEDATFTLTLTAGAHTLTLPPLVVQDFEEDHGTGGGVLSGIDLVMYRFTRSNHLLAPARGTSSAAVIEGLAPDIGMAGKFSNYSGWSFQIHEVESAGRTNMLVHIQRICDVACYEFRVSASDGGTCEFYPLDIWAAPSSPQPDWSSVVRRRAWADRVTRFEIVKTSRMSDAYILGAMGAGTVVGMGGLSGIRNLQSTQAGVTFCDGDPDSGGTQVGTGGFVFGSGAGVTHVRAETAVPPLVLRGTMNATAGTELAFCVSHDSGISPPRPADEPWSEDWIPTAAYAQSRTQTYLWRLNRHTHTLSWEGPPCLWLSLGYVLTWPGCPNSRVESITHTLGGGQASTSVESAALGSAQW
jgi:hypothetical protein